MDRLSLVCLISLLATAVIPPGPSKADPQVVKIMTYNIYYGGQDYDPVFGRDHEWLQVIKSRNPDVILIEEANGWLPEEENYIEAYVDSLNNAFPDDPPYEGYVGDATGIFNVALISRIPVLLFEEFRLVDIGDEIVEMSKVIIHAVLDAYEGEAHAIGAHFKSGDREYREKEARALLTVLDGLPAGETVWIGGDFNSYSPVDIDPESPTQPDYGAGALPPEIKGWEPIGYLLDRGYWDAFRTLHPLDLGYTQSTEGWPVGPGAIQRVDFLLRSPGGPWSLASAETIADSLGDIGSDHYAVFATYEWDPTSSLQSPGSGSQASSIQTWPNPAHGPTHIRYQLPGPCQVQLTIYSPSGRLVRALLTERQAGGNHWLSWDGFDQEGRTVPGGVYFLRLASEFGMESATILRTR